MTFFIALTALIIGFGLGLYVHYKFGAALATDVQKIRTKL
jgi:hypothetical protein